MKLVLRHTAPTGGALADVIRSIRHAHGHVLDTADNMVLFEASPSAAEEIAQTVEGWQLAQESVIPRDGHASEA